MTNTRFGIKTIKDNLVTLLGTTNVSDLNNGLSTSVKQVITIKPEQAVIPLTMYPTVNVWSGSSTMGFRGASDRGEVRWNYQIDMWVRDSYSIDNTKDQLELLSDNVLYILFNNTNFITNGYIKPISFTPEYNTVEDGFIAHGVIVLEVYKVL